MHNKKFFKKNRSPKKERAPHAPQTPSSLPMKTLNLASQHESQKITIPILSLLPIRNNRCVKPWFFFRIPRRKGKIKGNRSWNSRRMVCAKLGLSLRGLKSTGLGLVSRSCDPIPVMFQRKVKFEALARNFNGSRLKILPSNGDIEDGACFCLCLVVGLKRYSIEKEGIKVKDFGGFNSTVKERLSTDKSPHSLIYWCRCAKWTRRRRGRVRVSILFQWGLLFRGIEWCSMFLLWMSWCPVQATVSSCVLVAWCAGSGLPFGESNNNPGICSNQSSKQFS